MNKKEQIYQDTRHLEVQYSVYMKMLKNSIRWQKLIKLCGHLGDSSQKNVKIYQDDVTRTAHITVGNKAYSGEDIEFVFDGIPTPED